MSSIKRSTYQKVVEENKRLMHDLDLLTDESKSIHPDTILVKLKWRKYFKKEKDLNNFIRVGIRRILNSNNNEQHRSDGTC